MERASVAMDGDSRTAMDGAKCPLEWVPQALTEQLHRILIRGNVQNCNMKGSTICLTPYMHNFPPTGAPPGA